MPVTMHQTRREALLKQIDRPSPAKADLLNKVEIASKLLRLAIARAGLNQDQAMDALGISDKGQFSRMLDGKEKLWMHQFLRPEAQPIWKEVIFLAAQSIPGMTVERIVRLVEHA